MTQPMDDLMLPPLPRPYEKEVFATSANTESVRKGYEMGGYVKHPPLYTDDQMREYARLAVDAERAACARVCKEYAVLEHAAHHLFEGMPGKQLEKTSKAQGADECAAAILARRWTGPHA